MKFKSTGLLSWLFIGLFLVSISIAQDREAIADKYKWNLQDIFPDWDSWQQSMDELDGMINELTVYNGSLGTSADSLYKVLVLDGKIDMLAYRVFYYARLSRDTDTRNQNASAKLQQVQILFAKASTAASWVAPEILEIPWATLEDWLKEEKFAPYRFSLENLFRQQKHVLNEDKEKLLSYFNQFTGTPSSIYTDLSTSDIKFPKVTLASGEEVELTRANYGKILATNRNQADRKLAFENHYQTFDANKYTYAAIYNSVCQKDWASTQARNYGSTLEAALDEDNIPLEVYLNLVKTVRANTEPLKRWARLRKKVLDLEDYHLYDGSIPIVEIDKTYPYELAMKWVQASVKPLGESYLEKQKIALEGGWLDVFPNTGKYPGAYSAGVYGVHPYMLLNYNETLDYVFTLAHELGHSMHTQLANETQPFATSDYTIFVAEVASTFNERLLLDYLLEKTKDPKERIALLQQAISNLTGTFYFQTLLADYELQAHQLVETGQPVTSDALSAITDSLFTTYYGDAVAMDDLYKVIWARISHFYHTPYYVYQYATCYASSALIYKQIMDSPEKDRQTAVERYLDLLKSGGNDYPVNQLKKAGVDLSSPEPVLAVIQQLDELVSLVEKEIEAME
ncbi:oligoendopeptidase F [candidate division KSB1 bacterium]|nr:oligoendopeptidase F [candidate division KSB1 bacterium]